MADVSAAHAIANSLISQYVGFGSRFVLDGLASRGSTDEIREAAALAQGVVSAVNAVQNALQVVQLLNFSGNSIGVILGIQSGSSKGGKILSSIGKTTAKYRVDAEDTGLVGSWCNKCAQDVAKILKKQRVPGVHIRIKTPDGRPPLMYSDIAGKQVTNAGFHEAVITKIDGKPVVIDNIHNTPIPVNDWFGGIFSPAGLQLYDKKGNPSSRGHRYEIIEAWGDR